MNKDFFNDSDWYQIWGGDWSLLTCSYWGHEYTQSMWVGRLTFLDKAILIVENGKSVCFTPTASRNRFGQYLADRVVHDSRLAKLWPELLHIEVDRIRGFIKKYQGKDIDHKTFKSFMDIQYDYYIPHINIKYTVDYLNPELLEKYLPAFEEARVYAEPVFKETEEFTRELAQIVGTKTGYSPDLILNTLMQEFEQWFKDGTLPTKEVLQERSKESVLMFDHDGFELKVGNEATALEQRVIGNSKEETLKGMSAYPGKARGTVRVIADPHKADHFQDGDILVATMTRPEYLQLMKKAAAFVTDSGGILSHAAIVARELKKPCIIGTKIATKVLKDGDMVEVDANKGIVKIINR